MAPTPLFWDTLMAAEVPAFRVHKIIEEVLASRNEPLTYLQSRAQLTPAERERILAVDPRNLERTLELGATIHTGEHLPEALRDSVNPPPALYVWGNAGVLDNPCVAIVGTRGASTYGKAVAMKFAEALAHAGVTIVSGGAVGIDASAHKGALKAGGATTAVFATGIDGCYPSLHKGLFSQIRESGCLVSQFAAGAKPSRHRLVARNHTVAGLSQAVLVVEAPERSGALLTARAAIEMGRHVFVVPANIDHPGFRGSHALIRDGATLIDHPDHLLTDLGLTARPPARPLADLTPDQERIVEALTVEPISPELIVAKTGLPPEVVLSELTMLEIDGVVIQDLHGYARRP